MADIANFKRILAIVYIWMIAVLLLTCIFNPYSDSYLYKKLQNYTTTIVYLNNKTITSEVPVENFVSYKLANYLNNSNIPLMYWNNAVSMVSYEEKPCGRYPKIEQLVFNNIYWQVLHTNNGTFYFYNAYYDERKLSKVTPAVRVLSMIDRVKPQVSVFCQFWFNNMSVVVEKQKYTYIWCEGWGSAHQGILQPYLISCQIPHPYKHLIPVSVSIVANKCDTASNNLKVFYNKPVKKKDFLVCVKGLDFPTRDISIRLIEWIELLVVLGANKIVFYEFQVHPNVKKVLNHYLNAGLVEVVPLTLPGGQPNYPFFLHLYLTKFINYKRQNELIPYNDCFYKNIYSYKFIILLDVDEVIIPKKVMTWNSLMDTITKKARGVSSNSTTDLPHFKRNSFGAYCARHVYFFDDWSCAKSSSKGIPKYMHMLQHVYRSRKYSKITEQRKCFSDPELVLTLHNHYPMSYVMPTIFKKYEIETDDAQLQHYRADCATRKGCEKYRCRRVKDSSIWRYRDTLNNSTEAVLNQLHIEH